MNKSEPYRVRLDPDQEREYAAQAQAKDMPMSTYLRWRLQHQDVALEAVDKLGEELFTELGKIRRLVDSLEPQAPVAGAGQESPAQVGMLTEVLLLLRQVSKQDQVKFAQGEVRRQGLPIWDGIRSGE